MVIATEEQGDERMDSIESLEMTRIDFHELLNVRGEEEGKLKGPRPSS